MVRYFLLIDQGAKALRSFTAPRLRVGSSRHSDICLDAPEVADMHALFYFAGTSIRVVRQTQDGPWFMTGETTLPDRFDWDGDEMRLAGTLFRWPSERYPTVWSELAEDEKYIHIEQTEKGLRLRSSVIERALGLSATKQELAALMVLCGVSVPLFTLFVALTDQLGAVGIVLFFSAVVAGARIDRAGDLRFVDIERRFESAQDGYRLPVRREAESEYLTPDGDVFAKSEVAILPELVRHSVVLRLGDELCSLGRIPFHDNLADLSLRTGIPLAHHSLAEARLRDWAWLPAATVVLPTALSLSLSLLSSAPLWVSMGAPFALAAILAGLIPRVQTRAWLRREEGNL